MTVFERQARDSKIVCYFQSKSILPAVDRDFTCCRQNKPRNCFAINGERDTSKKKFIWMTLRYNFEKMLELNSVS